MKRVLWLASLLAVGLLLVSSCGGGGGEESPVQKEGTGLTLTDVRVDGHHIVVAGSTDLPDESTVNVEFDLWSASAAGSLTAVGTTVLVSEGLFEAKIASPRADEFRQGPYRVSVMFSPREQVEEILFLVGENGDRLSGELVEDTGPYNILRLTEKWDLQLDFTPLTFTFQEPSDFQKGTAERGLAEYMLAWRDRDWATMAVLAEKTWTTDQQDATRLLAGFYEDRTLRGFEIGDVDRVSESLIRITFIAQWETAAKQIIKKQITANVVRDALQFGADGRVAWGVDPLSTFGTRDVD